MWLTREVQLANALDSAFAEQSIREVERLARRMRDILQESSG